jgi:signal recognition particle GTPase
VKQFSEMQKMMKKMGGMGTKGKRRMPASRVWVASPACPA